MATLRIYRLSVMNIWYIDYITDDIYEIRHILHGTKRGIWGIGWASHDIRNGMGE